jgi:hypothetical protein
MTISKSVFGLNAVKKRRQYLPIGRQECRRYISIKKFKGVGDYINPVIDRWAKESTLAGNIPM